MKYLLQGILIFVAATANSAPIGRRIVVQVEISGCAEAPVDIDVVLDGDEGTRRPLVHDKTPGEDIWVGEWTDPRKTKFPSAPLKASLRLRNGRTYCRLATAAKDQNDRPVAKFTFHCDDAPVREVTVGTIQSVNTGSPTTFDYERRLPKKKARKGVVLDGLDCDCVEVGVADSGSRRVTQLLFPHENFSLYFLNDEEDGRSSDLLILDPEGVNPAATVPDIFDRLVRNNAVKPGGDSLCKGALCLRRGGIVDAMGKQRARAGLHLSSQEYALDEEILKKLSLLTLTVK